MEYTSSLQ